MPPLPLSAFLDDFKPSSAAIADEQEELQLVTTTAQSPPGSHAGEKLAEPGKGCGRAASSLACNDQVQAIISADAWIGLTADDCNGNGDTGCAAQSEHGAGGA